MIRIIDTNHTEEGIVYTVIDYELGEDRVVDSLELAHQLAEGTVDWDDYG